MNFASHFKNILLVAAVSFLLPNESAFAQPSANNTTPLVRIGKTKATPVIDGKLNDAAWTNSITLSDFSLTGSKRPATEQTRVKLAYDEKNLYVAWHCQESLLTIAQQRMHEVRARAKAHDADVFGDDNVLLFLQPTKDDTVYEFNVNSIGTLFDAQSMRTDLWGKRNAAWNAGAQSAAVQEDGFWTAELAVPWKALGLNTAPRIESAWQIGLARFAVGRGESSVWNQSESSSIHLFSNWGMMVFDNEVPGISSHPLADFEAGKSRLSIQLTRSPYPVEIEAFVNENNKTTRFQKTAEASEQTSTIDMPIAATSDSLHWQWVAKGTYGKELYRSPELLLSAQSTRARLKISTDKPWKLFVNHMQVHAGNTAYKQEVTFPLVNGVNDIIVETQSGTAQLELTPPIFAPPKPIAWRMAPANTDRKSAKNAWEVAPQHNGAIGIPGTPALLQHTLLYKATPYYPTTEPAFYIAEGTAQQMTFLAEGIPEVQLDNWHILLAVPHEFEVSGSSGFYGQVPPEHMTGKKAMFRTTEIGRTTIAGEQMKLYQVTADKPIIFQKVNQPLPSLFAFEVLFRLAKTAKHDPAKEWRFYYWSRSNAETVSEAPQGFAVRTTPPIRGKQPQKLVWEFWTSTIHVYDDRSLVPQILETSQQAGFNKFHASRWKDFNDMVRGYGMKTFTLIHFNESWTFNLVRPYLAEHPDEKLVDRNGKPVAHFMCTTKLMGDNWPLFVEAIQEVLAKADLDAVDYDYEYPPFTSPHACFCTRCLMEFRAFSKITDSIPLTPESVQQNHNPQWIDFMAYRVAVIMGKMKKAVHDSQPHMKFTSYSGYYDAQENTTKSRYGLDWNLVGQMQAVDEAGMGYGRPVPGITDSITALRGIPVKFGELLVPYDIRSNRPVAPLRKSALLRRALDATGGVLIYERKAMDGRSWYALGETTRLVADFEDLFIAHRLETIPGQNPDRIQVLKGEKQSLVCVMNETSKPATYDFRLPTELGKGSEYYSGKTVAAGETIQLTLEPGEIAVYVLQTN